MVEGEIFKTVLKYIKFNKIPPLLEGISVNDSSGTL